MQISRILITGATGFVGQVLCQRLLSEGINIRAAVRSSNSSESRLPIAIEQFIVGDIGPTTDWQEALAGVDVIIHLAARVHVMHEQSADAWFAYRYVNVLGTERLAKQAASAGVKRLVFLSSIKVNGEFTKDKPFTISSPENPQDPYGASKWEAEQLLSKIMQDTGLEVAIIRPPLVYGPGVKANFFRLMQWLSRGIPLPFGLIRNKRSMIFVGNLVDAIVLTAQHPLAKGKTYLVADQEDSSTPDLIHAMAQAFHKKIWLVPVPTFLLKILAALVNKQAEVERLTSSLQIDSSAIRKELGWKQPFSAAEGLEITVWHYIKSLELANSSK